MKTGVLTEPATNTKRGYLTTEQAAHYTGLSTSTLAKYRARGTGCPYIRLGQSATKARILYQQKDLDAWLYRHRIHTTGGAF